MTAAEDFHVRLTTVGRLIWKVPCIALGVVMALMLLLLVAAAGVVVTPSVRSFVLEKSVALANEHTDLDIDLGRLYLSPFHRSPLMLYRAYKGEADLPLQVEADSLFVGHRGQDTLLYVHALRLDAILKCSGFSFQDSAFTALPIVVERLLLDEATFHSDSLIAAVGIDAIVGRLDVSSPELSIAQGQYPLHGLRLDDAYIGIDLRTKEEDESPKDTTQTLMAFDVPDGELRNIHFAMTPLGMHIRTDYLGTRVLADVGNNLYDARRLDAGCLSLRLGELYLPFDTLYGEARVDLAKSMITSSGLHARSDTLGAAVDLSVTMLDLESMRVAVTGDVEYKGSAARLHGYYDIDDEAYDMQADVARVDVSPFLPDSTHVVVAGTIHAEGKGLEPNSPKMQSKVHLHLTDGIYDNIDVSGLRLDAELANRTVEGDLHLPVEMKGENLTLKGTTEHQFRVADFMHPERMQADYHAQIRRVRAHVAGEDVSVDSLRLDFATADSTSLAIATDGLTVDVTSPMHVMELSRQLSAFSNQLSGFKFQISNLASLDTLHEKIPAIEANIALSHGSPAQPILESMGLDINDVALSLASDKHQTDLTLDVSTPAISHPEDSTGLRLPPVRASLNMAMTEDTTSATLTATGKLTDGAMMVHNLQTDATLRIELERTGRRLNGTGQLTMDDLSFAGMHMGSRSVDITIAPSQLYANALRADVRLDDVPLDLLDSIIRVADLDLKGAVRAHAVADGLPQRLDLSAEVLPLGVSAAYKPISAEFSLGETPIIMEHNHVDFNGLPIYGADSTYLSLNGGLDLDSKRLNITLAADSFAPVKLVKDGQIPVHGGLAADVRGRVVGPLDSIQADVDVTILPSTDITYRIDKKNLAQVKPHGTVNVKYDVADGALNLGGRINVDDGFIRYSPKAYPIMPFHVDSGSHIAFNGPIGQTMIDVSASQKVKSSTQSEGEDSRMVDFTTGVRVHGTVDSIGMNSVRFFLEAPNDEAITNELEALDEETREGLAAALLATGMYMGESNTNAQTKGYALTSIINSRINAAMANSKRGKVIDIDFSSGKSQHASGESNDLNIALSKSFFNDRFRISLGAALSDNHEAFVSTGFLNNLSAEYKLTKQNNVMLRAFAQRDYNNIFEGELIKSGLGIRATQQWAKKYETGHPVADTPADSITRTYGLTADADIAWRSNSSLGPNLTLTSSIKNLLGNGEVFSVKANGAYYWALRDRHPGDPKKTDTYKLGVSTALVFPYLHWTGDNNPDGDTRYMIGYQYENIAGGYGVHKLSGSLTYFIRSSRYVTHSFTPFSLSIVRMNAESDSLMNIASEYPQLIKLLSSNEFVPAVAYHFTYNDYRAKRAVNTMLDLGIKESGNLINALYCAFGSKWNEKDKPLGSITFDQFVKLTFELHNKFNFTEKVCIATRLYAGANIPVGNSNNLPLSEAFYAGGTYFMRGLKPYSYGAGNFYSEKYTQNFFHAGDLKLEANFELRFPIVWKLFGAAFVDAGNVWTWHNSGEELKESGLDEYINQLQLREELYDGIIGNPYLARQIALGTGAGLRLDFDGLVIRLDLGVGIHVPYKTYKLNKDFNPDYSRPIETYFNIPNAWEALNLSFGIGYPF